MLCEEETMEEDTSKLEKEFEELVAKVHKEINIKIAEAAKMIEEAEKISTKYGIPFSSEISPIRNSFIPKTFKMPKKLDEDFVWETCDVYVEENYPGWEHSAVC